MIIKNRKEILSSEITPESVYRQRRAFLRAGIKASLAMGTGSLGWAASAAFSQEGNSTGSRTAEDINLSQKPAWLVAQLQGRKPAPASGPFTTDETAAPFEDATTFNNFYEFGTGKYDPAETIRNFANEPWSVVISGEVNKPGTYALEDILKPHTLEERIYRLRCVEGWSMVIPWIGFALGDLISRFEPTSQARYVEFQTLHDPQHMPGQRSRFSSLEWPYREGLRMDEAMHPLAILAVGLYDEILPAQNGAPLRLVVPWKYGFKSIKSIVQINFLRDMPNTSWNKSWPRAYGFYANVNPAVAHPSWSQATERRLPSDLFRDSNIKTQMFNGYAEEVAQLYAGMDLRADY